MQANTDNQEKIDDQLPDPMQDSMSDNGEIMDDNQNPEDIKKRLEAILFASGRKVTLDEMSSLCFVSSTGLISQLLKELKKEYEERDSPLLITPETDGWKLTVREKYLNVVQKINPHTELSKQAIETLAIIAWKQPILQADIINVRTTTAYDHIKELEDMGFITKVKYGRSFMLKTTPKFFDYFDIPKKDGIKQILTGLPVQELEAAFDKLIEKGKDQQAQQTLDNLEVYQTSQDQEDLEKKGMHPKTVVELETYEEKQDEEGSESQEDTGEESESDEGNGELTDETLGQGGIDAVSSATSDESQTQNNDGNDLFDHEDDGSSAEKSNFIPQSMEEVDDLDESKK